MATLLLAGTPAGTESAAGVPLTLRRWLGTDWALLFSHPGDFVRCEMEMDRWLSVMQRSFSGSRVKPLRLVTDALPAASDSSWIDEVSADASVLRLFAPLGRATTLDLKPYALREEISSLGRRRFVMIVDESLRTRRTFTYSALEEVRSPLEFLGWASAARARTAATAWARERRAALS
jgi:alkyl hydroperoxide reductase subunit AhpC